MKSLAHEIINPLNIIIGCAELTKLEGDIPYPITKNINEIIKQGLQCCQLLKSELESQHNNNLVNLYILLHHIIDDLETHPLIKIKNINLKILNKCNLTELCINRTYFKIVINNIILNSIKYSKSNSTIEIILSNECYNYTDNDNIYINIINTIDDRKEDYNYLNKSNSTGLTIIDNLTEKMSCKWNMIQDDNKINTQLICPV